MRIVLITLQMCVIGALFVLIAVPLLAALGGLLYALISAFEYVQAAVLMGAGEAFLFYSMQSMGMLPLAASPPAFIAAASSLATAGTAAFTICIPLLISLAINLILGFLAYYRNCYKRARFWAIVCNCVGLACYVLPQLIVLFVAEGEGLAYPVLVMALLWDSYFFLSILLWYFMPARPNAAAIGKCLPAAHIVLWLLLALPWAATLYALGAPATTATVVVTIAVVLFAAPFIVNAWFAKRIVTKGRKRVLLLVLAGDVVLASICLLLMPPIGVALLISTVWLYFSLETKFVKAMQPV